METPPPFPDLSLKENANRVKFLDWLYEVADRNNPNDPFCGRYTALAETYREFAGWVVMETTVASWDDIQRDLKESAETDEDHEQD